MNLLQRKYFYFFVLTVLFFFFAFNIKYNYILNQTIDYLVPEKNLKKNSFIQYECGQYDICGGWADRLKGIMSTYAISLLTNRQFIIKMTKNCDLKKILEPNEINWNYEQVPDNISIEELKIFNNQPFNQFKQKLSLFPNLNRTNMINVKYGMMFMHRLIDDPILKKKIKKLGYEQSKFHMAYQFHKWYKQLFKLNNRTQKKHDEFLQRLKPNSDSKLICCQIRKGDPELRDRRDDYVERDFWNFINTTFLSSGFNLSSQYKIFVTSDLEYVSLDAKNYFKNNEVIFSQNSSIHIDKELSNNECNKLESVILDFHIMQNCDIGVVSHSGFGVLALLNRPNPFKDLYVYSKEYKHLDMENETVYNSFFNNFKNLSFIKFSKLDDIYFFQN
ncbi:unnamed protein product [Brachionus calyciflorus]|uniref:Uncharacterized protein n=1 Tax=Brachionus calyciflorus TaxID=104777 RepID=A0A814A1H6_9BILA|nr:unnamed protein product [Brachionus calyciflorus]